MKNLDELGVPGTFVVTTEFRDAAEVQSKALGYRPGIVWVPHPIQNRTRDELREIAEAAIERVIEMITTDQTDSHVPDHIKS